jgi:glycosyltransferase involved in cell wall biosynthesis
MASAGKSICFIGMDNYPVLNPDYGDRYFGGESVQQTLLARAFKAIGYDVSMIVMDYGQPAEERIDGIRVLRSYRQEAGIPVVRFVHPRITSIWKAMRQANADVYYHSCAGMITGLVARFCKTYDRRFVFRIAHDTDCIPGQQLIKYKRDRRIYEYGLRNADLVVAQGVNQQALLKDNYQLDSVVINMAVELPRESEEDSFSRDILWVNNLRQFKRPDLAVEMARRLPDFSMTMVGGEVAGNRSLYDQTVAAAAEVPNLRYDGAVSYHDIGQYFSSSRLFLNTSDTEGFPNSFLQAWIRGVPVVSFFDPDGLISSRGLGGVPESQDEMVDIVRNLLQDDEERTVVSSRARDFALQHYAPKAVASVYDEYLSSSGGGR